ncbi:hypothetical protein C799_03004 [Bacteroides thetaiotaomicron dnLKV9]|uniref:Uncharacterized protein n=1 Tax=Bacteroides thetaiotaomicron dnLKV9 TaxID=1235785 RepID=R9HJ34_BACT4|nr:hypothetical protein C799_03004 [Bacteroides thetaiotaomicron dnLKV9]
MKNNGKTLISVGFYLRPLRSVVNEAINDNIIKRESYPFGTRFQHKYEIPKDNNLKNALSINDI